MAIKIKTGDNSVIPCTTTITKTHYIRSLDATNTSTASAISS